MGPKYSGHGKRSDESIEIPMHTGEGDQPQDEVNSVGDEHEKTSPHGAAFEFCEGDGNNTEAADASAHGGRGNFLSRG